MAVELSAGVDELRTRVDTLQAQLTDAESRLRALETPVEARTRDDRIPQLASVFDVRDAIFRPHARITQSVPQAFGAGTVIVTMEVTTFDNNFMADLANDQLVCRTAGIYLTNGFMIYDHAAGTRADLYIYRNGALSYFHCALGPALDIVNPSTMQCGGLIKLNVGDTLRLYVARGGAGDSSVNSDARVPFLEAFWVAPSPDGK